MIPKQNKSIFLKKTYIFISSYLGLLKKEALYYLFKSYRGWTDRKKTDKKINIPKHRGIWTG